jgi:hypothetical protein
MPSSPNIRTRFGANPRHRRDKAVAAAGYRLDAAIIGAVAVENATQSRDLNRQVGFLDGRSWPDGREDLVFCDQIALPIEQEPEKRGSSRTERQRLGNTGRVFAD